jgi:hypothetical protein
VGLPRLEYIHLLIFGNLYKVLGRRTSVSYGDTSCSFVSHEHGAAWSARIHACTCRQIAIAASPAGQNPLLLEGWLAVIVHCVYFETEAFAVYEFLFITCKWQ